jgi:hypothetical protein
MAVFRPLNKPSCDAKNCAAPLGPPPTQTSLLSAAILKLPDKLEVSRSTCVSVCIVRGPFPQMFQLRCEPQGFVLSDGFQAVAVFQGFLNN